MAVAEKLALDAARLLEELLGALVPLEELLEGGHIVEARCGHRMLDSVGALGELESVLCHSESVCEALLTEELPM